MRGYPIWTAFSWKPIPGELYFPVQNRLVVSYAKAENPQGNQETLSRYGKGQGKASPIGNEPSGCPNESQTQAEPSRDHMRGWD